MKALEDFEPTPVQERTASMPAPEPPPADPGQPRHMVLNMGPQHPSTHGVLRVLIELDGETVKRAEPDIGYLHTGIEKEFEAKTWVQGVTLTDRVDYLANLSNNLVYALAVELDNDAKHAVSRGVLGAHVEHHPPSTDRLVGGLHIFKRDVLC